MAQISAELDKQYALRALAEAQSALRQIGDKLAAMARLAALAADPDCDASLRQEMSGLFSRLESEINACAKAGHLLLEGGS